MRHGFRMARAGEFTQRAFLNGKMDLSQAEAVADLIASESEAAHRVALQQLRGGFAKQLKELRQNFIDFAAMIELELDFSEEDVEFADRSQLRTLLLRIETEVERLSSSFSTGQAIKDGIPVCIAGAPNAGKSTLLNALLQEEKALVSQVPGTTRDSIEDVLLIDGLKFRLIDTAGIRSTDDQVEQMGIDRTYQKMEQAALVLFLIDLGAAEDVHQQSLKELNEIAPDKIVRVVLNKVDAHPEQQAQKIFEKWECLSISAKMQNGLTELKSAISQACSAHFSVNEHSLVANARHHGELQCSLEALSAVRAGLDDRLSGELIAQDMRRALEHLGNITGEIASDELLGSIFSRFCIGK
jgi:tRNA modification GTPase